MQSYHEVVRHLHIHEVAKLIGERIPGNFVKEDVDLAAADLDHVELKHVQAASLP